MRALMVALALLLLVAILTRGIDDPQPPADVPPTATTTTAPEATVVPVAAVPTVPTTTTSAPHPTARTAPMAATGDVPDIVRAGFARFGPVVAEQAVRVASCETGGTFNPSARNGSNVGVMQLNGQFHRERAARLGYRWEQMTDPRANVAVAASLYADEGWAPWSCRGAA